MQRIMNYIKNISYVYVLLNINQIKFRLDCRVNPCDSAVGIQLFCYRDCFNCIFSVHKYQFILFVTRHYLIWLSRLIQSQMLQVSLPRITPWRVTVTQQHYFFSRRYFTCFVDWAYSEHFAIAFIFLRATYLYSLMEIVGVLFQVSLSFICTWATAKLSRGLWQIYLWPLLPELWEMGACDFREDISSPDCGEQPEQGPWCWLKTPVSLDQHSVVCSNEQGTGTSRQLQRIGL